MQVSFKGLYRIPGNSDTQQVNSRGESICELRNTKLQGFLEDIKPFRSQSGYSFYDYNTGDYYIGVSDMHDSEFEETAQDYKIDYYRLGKKLIRNNAPAEQEYKALNNMLIAKVQDLG